MDKDLESRIERICDTYAEAQARMVLSMPVADVTGRQVRRSRATLVTAISDLQRRRDKPTRALVRLAFVRGMRQVDPESRMGPKELERVTEIQGYLNQVLNQAESGVLKGFRIQTRKVSLAQTMRWFDYPEETMKQVVKPYNYPLEQYARQGISTVVDQAFNEGVAAALPATV